MLDFVGALVAQVRMVQDYVSLCVQDEVVSDLVVCSGSRQDSVVTPSM